MPRGMKEVQRRHAHVNKLQCLRDTEASAGHSLGCVTPQGAARHDGEPATLPIDI